MLKATKNPLFELPFGYAELVVDGVIVQPISTEAFTMLVLNIVLLTAAIGFLCWLVFTLAVYALPLFVRHQRPWNSLA